MDRVRRARPVVRPRGPPRCACRSRRPTSSGTAGSWFTFIRRVKEPDLIVTLLEDTAALLGLLFAFAGVGLAELTGNAAWDGGGSVAIGLLLAGVAVVVGRETQSLLIGEAASDEAEKTIVKALEAGPEVEKVIHLRTVHLSPDSLLVAAKTRSGPATPARRSCAASTRPRAGSARPCRPLTSSTWSPTSTRSPGIDDTDPSIRTVQRAWGDYDGPDYPRGTRRSPSPVRTAPCRSNPLKKRKKYYGGAWPGAAGIRRGQMPR